MKNLNIQTEKLVDDFAIALKVKLLKAQEKYGFTNNWLNDNWENECQDQLINHIDKGDPLDVAAYCAFMWLHNWKTISDPKPLEPTEIRRLNQFISDVLDIEDIEIEDIKQLARDNGFICKLVGGDDKHGSYTIFQKFKAYSVAITKCHCGHIHLLEDMCIECNPDLKDNFLGNGTPITIIQNETEKPMKILKITWLESCGLCGFSEYLNVTTERGIGCYLWDGDKINCPNCGNTGEIICEDGRAFVSWHTELPF